MKIEQNLNGLTHEDLKPVESHNSSFRLNSDRTVAVAPDLYWLPMKDAPVGVKLHVLNPGKVATHSVITEATRKDWLGWQRIPSIPDWM